MAPHSKSRSIGKLEAPIGFGRHKLLYQLEQGSLGDVYFAVLEGWSREDRRRIVRCLPVGLAERETLIDAFQRETTRPTCRTLTSTLEGGFEGDVPFLAYEHWDALPLSRFAELAAHAGAPISPETALHIVAHVLDALRQLQTTGAAFGAAGGAHGAVRSKSVLLTAGGGVVLEGGFSFLGGARVERCSARLTIERPAPPFGVPPLPPLDPRTDLLDALTLLWSLLAGRPQRLLADLVEPEAAGALLPDTVAPRFKMELVSLLGAASRLELDNAADVQRCLVCAAESGAMLRGREVTRQLIEALYLNEEITSTHKKLVELGVQKIRSRLDAERLGDGRLWPGCVLDGKLEIIREIGCGGMGRVFEAFHVGLDERKAVKVLESDNERDLGARGDRFRREAELLAGLRHPNVVSISDMGVTAAEQQYIVMERLEGETLAELIARTLPEQRDLAYVIEVLRALIGAAAGLCAAHGQGIVHRDVKPSNLFLHRAGGDGPLQAKLIDFGIARPLSSAKKLTATGAFLGTAEYAPPERLSGHPPTPAEDIYGLGVTLYTALVGHTPFRAELATVSLAQISSARFKVPPPSADNHCVPRRLDKLCLKAMSREPSKRHASAALLKADLEAALNELLGPTRPLRTTPKPKRHVPTKGLLYGAGGLVASLLVLLVIWLWPTADAPKTPFSATNALQPTPTQPTIPKTKPPTPEPPRAPVLTPVAVAAPAAHPLPSRVPSLSRPASQKPKPSPMTAPEASGTAALLSEAESALARLDLATAEQKFRAVAKAEPQSARAELGLGKIAFERGQSERALTHARRAAALAPGSSDATRFVAKAEAALNATQPSAPPVAP